RAEGLWPTSRPPPRRLSHSQQPSELSRPCPDRRALAKTDGVSRQERAVQAKIFLVAHSLPPRVSNSPGEGRCGSHEGTDHEVEARLRRQCVCRGHAHGKRGAITD